MSAGVTLRRVTNLVPVLLIKFYRRFISPLFPPTCRFHPSCSAYGLKAFQTHSFFKAVGLTCWRILRCNPFNPGGYDPVPGCEEDATDGDQGIDAQASVNSSNPN